MDTASKVGVVKSHVDNVKNMLHDTKKNELEEEGMKTNMAFEKMIQTSVPPPAPLSCQGAAAPMVFKGQDICIAKGSSVVSMSGINSADFDEESSELSVSFKQRKSFPRTSKKLSRGGRGGSTRPDYGPQFTSSRKDDDIIDVPGNSMIPAQSFAQKDNEIMIDCEEEEDKESVPDFTKLPEKLDCTFEKFSGDEKYGGIIRSTTIKAGNRWKKKAQSSLLSPLLSSTLLSSQQRSEKDKAFDLLDALSRSGSLPISCAELHIVVTSTHCFEKSVVDTVISDNINPIEKIERSHLIIATIINETDEENLVRDKNDLERIRLNY